VTDFLLKHKDEIIGLVTGLVYLYFSIRQNIWLWPVGIVASGYAAFVFFETQLYADMSLNIYYILVSIYGWFHWLLRNDNVSHKSIKISVLQFRDWIVYLALVVILTVIIAELLIHVPGKIGLKPSSVPWWDAFLTAGSIVATWMLARKILEQWLWWIVIDALSVGVLLYKELYFFAILFGVYTVMSVYGYKEWKKDYQRQ
jgi:nicotinamide mononucleotide transporter